MSLKKRLLVVSALGGLCANLLLAVPPVAQTRRLVVVKVDGLPADLIEEQLKRNSLPWIRHIFVEQGSWVRNFYVRGISLSAPSWSMLDTGQHQTIHGNAEFDRFIPRVYDYLNFFPFYRAYARLHRVDMPGVEVLDQFGVPLLLDQFAPTQRYETVQLFQRGVRWKTLGESLQNRLARPAKDLIDEWATGFEFSPGIEEQQEKELIAALANPQVVYLDYFTGGYDHTAHLTQDEATQLAVVKQLDARLGRLWTAIQASPLAAETTLVLVSDHGMTTSPETYSQGYSLVKLLNSGEGGGHHVVTVRHPLTEFKLRGLNPFVSYVVSPSIEASYLRNQNDYPTALLDPDGNERASLQLRNSDLNAIHILLLQLQKPGVAPARGPAIRKAILHIIEANHEKWSQTYADLGAELAALHRTIEREQALVKSEKGKYTYGERVRGLDQDTRRHQVDLLTWQIDERGYRDYLQSLGRLLALKDVDLDIGKLKIESLLPKGVMGESNSLAQLQNYVVSLSREGMVFDDDGTLNLNRSFRRLNYFSVLASARVRNNVQPGLGSAPIDFSAARVLHEALPPNLLQSRPNGLFLAAIFLHVDNQHQALLLEQVRDGERWLRYIPVCDLFVKIDGLFQFTPAVVTAGFPLHLFEDPDLQVPGDRSDWLSAWHTEQQWFEAIHRTRYSNGLIGLFEYFERWQPDELAPPFQIAEQRDLPLLRRFAERRRELTESDLLILASDHWNFNVRGFNPGGNHGSFFRMSTHSMLMVAGGEVAAGKSIERPYDSLSVVPTLLTLMGRLPVVEKAHYPGPVITEMLKDAPAN